MIGPGLEEKRWELVFRYNHRGNWDIFLGVLCFMLLEHQCCVTNCVLQQLLSVLQ